MANKRLRRTRAPVNEKKAYNQPKTNDKIQPVKQKALVLAQEIKITRLLANNDKKVRDKVLKRLKKWLVARSQSSFEFTKKDFFTLWKGLFYCMWMSDKMLIQEELAESLSKLVHCFHEKNTIVLYTSCALKTLAKEWFGIDQYRLDKFSMLVRRMLRQTFVVCKNRLYDMEWVTEISQVFEELLLSSQTGLGFSLHMTEIYLEELAKISGGNIPKDVVHQFIKPFAVYLTTTKDERQIKHIIRHVFRYLIFQSDVGLDYMEKFEAWKDAGFPCTHVDKMQKVEVSDVEENSDNENKQLSKKMQSEMIEKPLDPRAGRVNVELPQIPFDAASIIKLLKQYRFHWQSTSKSRRQISRLITEFEELSKGEMPLGIKRVRKPQIQKGEMSAKKAALRLIEFEQNLKIDDVDPSVDNFKYEDNSNLKSKVNMDTADSESNIGLTTKSKLHNTEVNTAFSKKRKKELIVDKSDDMLEPTKKKKLKTKSCNMVEKVEFKKVQGTDMTRDNNLKRTTAKKPHFLNAHIESVQYTSSSPTLKKKNRPKKTDKSMSNTLLKDNVSQNIAINNTAQISLKKTLSNQVKKQTNLNNSTQKKKVVFGLSRNSAQQKSEYLQQVRKSPAIPFDANKKPLASVLKASPISSPLNPFYKIKRTVKKYK